MSFDMGVPVIVICIGLVACVFDVRTRRIPNALTMGAAVAGLFYHGATSGVGGVQTAAAGWILGLLLLLPYFALGGMGGGDVKLVAALGAWLGPWETFWLAMYAGIAGGVIGLFVALAHRYLKRALVNVSSMFGHWAVSGLSPVPGMTLETSTSPRLAYAIPILAGTMVTLWLK
jgi:prepilin peptidase CpaA